jgi:hypothetical protein
VPQQQEYLIKVLLDARNNLIATKLSIILAERCTFDCQFLYFVLISSILLHGRPSFPKSFYFGNEYIVAQRLEIGKQKISPAPSEHSARAPSNKTAISAI